MTGTDRADWIEITDAAQLRELVGAPAPAARDKERSRLNDTDRAWLAASPLCVIGTADAAGNGDVSPKGDPAGSLVHVLDDATIAIAERPGNKRVDGYLNVIENPYVALLFVIPGRGDTLRINGRARLVRDAPFFDAMVVKGHRPLLALVVEIDTIFSHCAKAFLRSQLWQPETWDPTGTVPRRAVLAKLNERPDADLAELDAYYGPSYADGLYRQH